MEAKFQTSFIPKKPLVTQPPGAQVHHSTSLFMVFAVFLFILSLAGAGFVVLWQKVLVTAQDGYKAQLEKSRNQFDPTLIEELKRANTKIDLSTNLLRGHLAASEVFDIISQLTIEGVRFRSFDFSSPTTPKDPIKLTLKGEGANFSTIAFQSDVLGQSAQYGTNKLIKNPVLSDLTLGENGKVNFTLTASLDPSIISYEKVLTGDSVDSATSTDDGTGDNASSTPGGNQ